MRKQVGLYTLGCKVSQYETQAIAEAFAERGFDVVSPNQVCDVYVVNTCTVTAEADRKCRQVIRRLQKKNPHARILVTGCYSQVSPEAVANIPGVSYVCGTAHKLGLVDKACQLLAGEELPERVEVTPLEGEPFESMCIHSSPRTRAYVKIEDGCECRCTYCIIPYARGEVRSKPPREVIEEIEGLCRGGTQEVVLTGIETASYGVDLQGYRLIDLLEEIDRRFPHLRVRLGSLTPCVMTEDFVTRLSRLTTPVPHFHLSMQSGSDSVLRGMKRRYNTAMALSAMERLRSSMPGVQFTTDLLVGFPGESEELFLETLDFARRARFLSAHVFTYSRRPGTPAATYEGQVEESEKTERSHRLTQVVEKIQGEILDEYVQKQTPLRLLLETRQGDVWQGHTDEFLEATVAHREGYHQGQLLDVLPLSHEGGILKTTV